MEVFQRENVSLKLTLCKENVCFELSYDNGPTRPLLYRSCVVNSKQISVYIQSCKMYLVNGHFFKVYLSMRIVYCCQRTLIPTSTVVFIWVIVFIHFALYGIARGKKILLTRFQYPLMCLNKHYTLTINVKKKKTTKVNLQTRSSK